MHLFRKVAMGLGISLLALEEIIKRLYDPIYSGAIFLGTGIKIKHKFLNYLNNQNTKFLVVGDGYNKWDCSGFGKIGAESLFLYSNVQSDYNGNYHFSLCGLDDTDIQFQLESILQNTTYQIPYLAIEKRPSVVEIFGSLSEVLLDELSGLTTDTLLISHSGSEHSSMSSISDTVILEMMSTFVNDVYYRFVLSILLNPDKTILADGISKFIVEPTKHKLCSDKSIVEFQDSVALKFKDFYSSLNSGALSPKTSMMSEFFREEKLPSWYKDLQSKHLEDFKTLLLMQNILFGNLDEVRCLVDEGVSISKSLYNGVTPLLVSVQTGNEKTVKFCLEKGADMNQARDNGVTPIIAASHFKDNGILKILLEKGADLEMHKQLNALNVAYEVKNYDAVPIILKTAFASEYEELAKQFVKGRIHMECFNNGKTEFSSFYEDIVGGVSPDPSSSYMLGIFTHEFALSLSEQSCLLAGIEQQQT